MSLRFSHGSRAKGHRHPLLLRGGNHRHHLYQYAHLRVDINGSCGLKSRKTIREMKITRYIYKKICLHIYIYICIYLSIYLSTPLSGLIFNVNNEFMNIYIYIYIFYVWIFFINLDA